MSTKIHPHLKAFIKSVVLAEMSNIGPSKSYLYKEELMKEIQGAVLENLDSIQSKEDMDKVIDDKTSFLKEEMNRVIQMINNTMKNVPLEVLKKVK
jgi:hypothetical protein